MNALSERLSYDAAGTKSLISIVVTAWDIVDFIRLLYAIIFNNRFEQNRFHRDRFVVVL